MDIVEVDFNGAVQEVLKNARAADGLLCGLKEVTKAMEKRKAICCFLAESCDDTAYTQLIEALCSEHDIPLIKLFSFSLFYQIVP